MVGHDRNSPFDWYFVSVLAGRASWRQVVRPTASSCGLMANSPAQRVPEHCLWSMAIADIHAMTIGLAQQCYRSGRSLEIMAIWDDAMDLLLPDTDARSRLPAGATR
jgi:hypothetical protein